MKVGPIFNIAKVTQFLTPLSLSLSLGQRIDDWTIYLAYIESIVDSCANDIEHTENNKIYST